LKIAKFYQKSKTFGLFPFTGGKFCAKDFCTTMWLSTAGYRDFAYYRSCLGDNPITVSPSECNEEFWAICTKKGGCNPNIPLTNDYFPVALRSIASGMCIDCSATGSWCKQATCPAYAHNGSPGDSTDDAIDAASETYTGPQFQIHNFERGVNEPLQVLDEVHFSYASSQVGTPKFLSGDIYSAAFLRTQYYMRLEDKFSVSSKKTGVTSGPFSCPTGKAWSMMNMDERAACAQSSLTLFKRINPECIISTSDECSERPYVSSGGSRIGSRNQF
jgi:hypothetical protein